MTKKFSCARELIKDQRLNPSLFNNLLLTSSIRCECEEMINLLIADPRVNITTNKKILLHAVLSQNIKIVESLINIGIIVDSEALRHAAMLDEYEIFKLLLKNSTDIDLTIIRNICYKAKKHDHVELIDNKK